MSGVRASHRPYLSPPPSEPGVLTPAEDGVSSPSGGRPLRARERESYRDSADVNGGGAAWRPTAAPPPTTVRHCCARMKLTRSRGRGWWKQRTTRRGWRVPLTPLTRRDLPSRREFVRSVRYER